MKTNLLKLEKVSLAPMIMLIVMALITMGCQEKHDDGLPAIYAGDILTESFTVMPEGITLKAFDESVTLDFPGGTVFVPTELTLVSFPLNNLDMKGINIMNRGFSLKSSQPEHDMHENVMINLTYNFRHFLDGAPAHHSNLTIYKITHDFKTFTECESIGECCVDDLCNMISGCFDQCGFYVVGEK